MLRIEFLSTWCEIIHATSHYLGNVDPDLYRNMVSLVHSELTSKLASVYNFSITDPQQVQFIDALHQN